MSESCLFVTPSESMLHNPNSWIKTFKAIFGDSFKIAFVNNNNTTSVKSPDTSITTIKFINDLLEMKTDCNFHNDQLDSLIEALEYTLFNAKKLKEEFEKNGEISDEVLRSIEERKEGNNDISGK